MAVNRYYSSTAVDTTLASGITSSSTSIVVSSTQGFPTSYPYTLALDYDTSAEELINVVGASGTTLTVGTSVGVASTTGRGVDGTTAQSHSAGAAVKHVISGRDMREAQEHIAASTNIHGITDTSVLTTNAGTQTLTNKTLTSPAIAGGTLSGTLTNSGTISGGSITGAAVTGGSITGAAITGGSITGTVGGNPTFSGTVTLPSTTSIGTVSATEIGYVDGVTSAIQTQMDTKAPLASPTFTGTVTLPTGVTGATGAITSNMIADGTIVNADINASAAIAASKIADTAVTLTATQTMTNKTLTAPTVGGTAVMSSGAAISTNGVTITDVELGYLDGVTSAIQTQLGAKAVAGSNHVPYKMAANTTGISASSTGAGSYTGTLDLTPYSFDYAPIITATCSSSSGAGLGATVRFTSITSTSAAWTIQTTSASTGTVSFSWHAVQMLSTGSAG